MKILTSSLEACISNDVQANGRAPDFALALLPINAHFEASLAELSASMPNTPIAGCNAHIQFLPSGLFEDGVVQQFWFSDSSHSIWCEVVSMDENKNAVTEHAVQRLCTDKPDAAILLVDGVNYPVDQLLDAIRTTEALQELTIVGGLASKPTNPESLADGIGPWVFFNGEIHKESALILGLQGIEINTQIIRGWEPASPGYTVTEACGNILRTIDGRNAVDWYADFFAIEGHENQLPLASYGFPLIIDGPCPSRKNIYRTMLAYDDPKGCVTFYGDIQTGDRIRLGIGHAGSLVDAASMMTKADADACLLFSCVAREAVLGDDAEKEILVLNEHLQDIPLTGFFTFGEIGPSEEDGLAYYNQTGIVALLKEKRNDS